MHLITSTLNTGINRRIEPMKFNQQTLKEFGLQGMKNKELLEVLATKIKYLLLHNKNYTKQQYYELQDIAEIVSAMEG